MPAILIKQIETPALELNEDGEFVCPHTDYHWETVEVDTMRNGEHDTYEQQVAVCSACDESLPDIEMEGPDYD
jgi:hypothetical protein